MTRHSEAFAEAMKATGTRNTAVVEHLGGRISPSDVSNWRVGRRPMPAEHAPAVAALLNVQPEEISQAYERMVLAGLPLTGVRSTAPRPAAGHVSLDRLEEFGLQDGPTRIVLPEFLIRPRIGLSPIQNIRWTLQPTEAMEPEIKRHALVLVDTTGAGLDHVVDSGAYAYTLWGRPDIRRIQIRRDAWCLVRHGSGIEHTIVPDADLEHLRILGAICGWINPP